MVAVGGLDREGKLVSSRRENRELNMEENVLVKT